MSITNIPININPSPSLNSNRHLSSVNDNQQEPTINKENKKINKSPQEKTEIKAKKNKKNTSKKLIQFLLIFLSLIIISFIILMIGYFYFDWFKKKEDLVVQIKREENLVTRYL